MVFIADESEEECMGHHRNFPIASLSVIFLLATGGLRAQAGEAPLPDSPGAVIAQQDAPGALTHATSPEAASAKGEQSKRILGILPNFRSVSVGEKLPPLSPRQKLVLAVEDSLDYSSFLKSGVLAGISQARDSYPEFHQGAAGYGRYYWHELADSTLGDAATIFLLPVVTREDPRYYTLGHGGFIKRGVYAVSRVVVTRTDNGNATANVSEIAGQGMAAGISRLYYPSKYRTFSEAGQKWALAVAVDGISNGIKEFWPDVHYWLSGRRK